MCKWSARAPKNEQVRSKSNSGYTGLMADDAMLTELLNVFLAKKVCVYV